jgi:hypothetical protein
MGHDDGRKVRRILRPVNRPDHPGNGVKPESGRIGDGSDYCCSPTTTRLVSRPFTMAGWLFA